MGLGRVYVSYSGQNGLKETFSTKKIKKKVSFQGYKRKQSDGGRGERQGDRFLYFYSFFCRVFIAGWTQVLLHNMLKWIRWKKRNYLMKSRMGLLGRRLREMQLNVRTWSANKIFVFILFSRFKISKLSGVKWECFLYFMVFLPGFVDSRYYWAVHIYMYSLAK